MGGNIRLLTILFTNDFHNHLNAAQSSYLSRLRTTLGTRGLLLDAGDAVGSGNITFQPSGEPILCAMSEIGYNAITVGNREFHISQVGFRSKVALARFPVLCANVHLQKQCVNAAAPVQQYIVHDFDVVSGKQFRIVIFGLTVPMVTARMLARKVSAYLFDDPLATAATLVPHLREHYKPDLLVALTHIGIGQDRKLAQNVPDIDLIIGGHTHVVLEQGEHVGNTLIAQAGSHGRFVGRVDIDFSSLYAVNVSSEAPRGAPYRLTASLSPLPKEPSEMFINEQIQSLLHPNPPEQLQSNSNDNNFARDISRMDKHYSGTRACGSAKHTQ